MRLAEHAVIEVAQEETLGELMRQVADRFVKSQWTQAIAWLILAAFADMYLALGGAGRILYLVPVWLLAERHSRGVAYLAALAGPFAHLIFGRGTDAAPQLGFAIQVAVGIAIVFRIDGHLRNAAKAAQDPLTGLLNRKGIQAYAVKEIERCVQEEKPLTIAVIDCDKFKQLNDIYGHAKGDEVLKLLAYHVEKAMGRRCRLGRTGGDEFVAVLPGVPLREAERRLHHAGEMLGDATIVEIGTKATISVGFASSAEVGFTLTDLLKTADDDMYKRKASKKQGALFGLPR